MTQHRRIVWILTLGWLIAGLAGCTGAPDRREQADDLAQMIRAMPGVADASVSYENVIGRGASLYMDIYLPAATRQQIVEIAAAMNRIRGHDFDEFYQRIAFHPTGSPTVSISRGAALDPGQIADQSLALRQLSATVSASEMTWRDTDPSRIELFGLDTPAPQTLAAIRTVAGNQTLAAQLRPHIPSTQTPNWQVLFPFSADQQATVEAQLASMPARPTFIDVKNGAIASLNVQVSPTVDAAYNELLTVINVTHAGPQQPLWLRFSDGGQQPDPRTTGFVTIGQCSYPPNTNTQIAAGGLQQLLRQKFDTCPR